MRRKLSKMSLWIVMCIFTFWGQQIAANVKNPIKRSQELTFEVMSQDLYFDHNDILVNVHGHNYPVNTLQRNGDRWIVTAIAAHDLCAWGHPLCAYCHQCHTRHCQLHQSRCFESQ